MVNSLKKAFCAMGVVDLSEAAKVLAELSDKYSDTDVLVHYSDESCHCPVGWEPVTGIRINSNGQSHYDVFKHLGYECHRHDECGIPEDFIERFNQMSEQEREENFLVKCGDSISEVADMNGDWTMDDGDSYKVKKFGRLYMAELLSVFND